MENGYVDLLTELAIKMKWKGKDVWVAKKVSEVLGYKNPSKAVNYFLTSGGLLENEDYIVLSKNDLRDFKNRLVAMEINEFRQSPKLVLFYESALVEFLRYRNKLSCEEVRLLLSGNLVDEVIEDTKVDVGAMVKNFKGTNIYTLIWNGKACWGASNIAGALGYSDKTKAVSQCVISEEFQKGEDYDVLNAKEVREVIKANGDTPFASGELITHLTIFYKKGLLGFINYAHMPLGKELRKWLRDEVFEELIDMEVGDTLRDSKFSIKDNNLSESEVHNTNQNKKRVEMLNTLNIVDKILDETSERKLGYLDCIFRGL